VARPDKGHRLGHFLEFDIIQGIIISEFLILQDVEAVGLGFSIELVMGLELSQHKNMSVHAAP